MKPPTGRTADGGPGQLGLPVPWVSIGLGCATLGSNISCDHQSYTNGSRCISREVVRVAAFHLFLLLATTTWHPLWPQMSARQVHMEPDRIAKRALQGSQPAGWTQRADWTAHTTSWAKALRMVVCDATSSRPVLRQLKNTSKTTRSKGYTSLDLTMNFTLKLE